MALLQQFEVSLTASRRHFGDKMESDFISSQQNAEVFSKRSQRTIGDVKEEQLW